MQNLVYEWANFFFFKFEPKLFNFKKILEKLGDFAQNLAQIEQIGICMGHLWKIGICMGLLSNSNFQIHIQRHIPIKTKLEYPPGFVTRSACYMIVIPR